MNHHAILFSIIRLSNATYVHTYFIGWSKKNQVFKFISSQPGHTNYSGFQSLASCILHPAQITNSLLDQIVFIANVKDNTLNRNFITSFGVAIIQRVISFPHAKLVFSRKNVIFIGKLRIIRDLCN